MRWLLLALPLALAFACTDDERGLDGGVGDGGVFRGTDMGVASEPDSGTGPRVRAAPADLLFVVDNSASMAISQERLADGFAAFVTALGDREGLRVGVVSTDLDSPGGERGGMITHAFSGTYPNPLLSFDGSACVNVPAEHGCFRNAQGASEVIDSSQLSRDELLSQFSAAVLLGTCGHGMERGLDAMLRALESDGCGSDPFIRAEANLTIVFVTDEEDASTIPIAQAVTELARFKPLEQTRVVVIAGLWEGAAAACAPNLGTACGSLCANRPADGSQTACRPGGTCPSGEYCDPATSQCENEALQFWSDQNCSWCSFYQTPDCCAALPGQRYYEFARTFESAASAADPSIPVVGCDGTGARPVCLLESICQEDLGATMARIADKLLLLPDE